MQTFLALMERDIRVLGRDFVEFATRIVVQPFLFVFVFGYVLVGIGQVKPEYVNLLLPGILAASMMMAGVQGTAVPLSQDFGHTKEIEDRLMSPISLSALIFQKILMGTLQAWIAAALVFPIAWGIMRSNLHISVSSYPLLFLFIILVGITSACMGLFLGTQINPMKLPIMFATIIIPMVFLGATYYPWMALSKIDWLQKLILINPMVYSSEGFRSVLTANLPHIDWYLSVAGLLVAIIVLTFLGVMGFSKRAYS